MQQNSGEGKNSMKWLYGEINDYTKAEYDAVYNSLAVSRKERIDRFKLEDDRRRSLLGEMLTKKLLTEEGILSPIESAENGRPYIKDNLRYISISHSNTAVVAAVSDSPVGIDIEQIKPVNRRLVKRICTDEEEVFINLSNEKACDQLITEEKTLERFFVIWTAKEAWFKKQGTGITDFKKVNVLNEKREVHRKGEYIIQII